MKKERKTIIYFVRHGAVDKPKNAWAGIINLHFKLSKEGKKQIRKVGEYLSEKKISAIYSSPINRAYQSAEIISKNFKIKPIKSKELFEWKLEWKGKTQSEIGNSKEWQIYLTTPTKLKNGETIKKLAIRMQNFCNKILKKHSGEEIICVSHQDPIRALRLKLENKSLDLLNEIPCNKGSITIFCFDGKLSKIKYLELK